PPPRRPPHPDRDVGSRPRIRPTRASRSSLRPVRPRLALATAFVLILSACTPDHHSSSNVASSIGSAASPRLGEAGPAAGVGAPTSGPSAPGGTPATIPDPVTGGTVATNPAIVAENSRPGTTEWRIDPT